MNNDCDWLICPEKKIKGEENKAVNREGPQRGNSLRSCSTTPSTPFLTVLIDSLWVSENEWKPPRSNGETMRKKGLLNLLFCRGSVLRKSYAVSARRIMN